jgi:hypothetical protein
MFIEKPISTDTVERSQDVGRALFDSQTVVSVGYFLRYLKGESDRRSSRPKLTFRSAVVQKMRSVIEDNDLHVMATVARYVCSYAKIDKPAWWMKSKDCGPIVEQATHFVDLSRYFGGDVILDSVQASSLEWYEEAGELSVIPVNEEKIAEDDRIPRVTSATWFVSSSLALLLRLMSTLQEVRDGSNWILDTRACVARYQVLDGARDLLRWILSPTHRPLQQPYSPCSVRRALSSPDPSLTSVAATPRTTTKKYTPSPTTFVPSSHCPPSLTDDKITGSILWRDLSLHRRL